MSATYYGAHSEDGDRIDDPSEDALFMMLGDLHDPGNTFLVVRPDGDDPGWSVSVTLLGPDRYEVVRQDTVRDEHTAAVSTSAHDLAHDLTRWAADRDRPAARGDRPRSPGEQPRGRPPEWGTTPRRPPSTEPSTPG